MKRSLGEGRERKAELQVRRIMSLHDGPDGRREISGGNIRQLSTGREGVEKASRRLQIAR